MENADLIEWIEGLIGGWRSVAFDTKRSEGNGLANVEYASDWDDYSVEIFRYVNRATKVEYRLVIENDTNEEVPLKEIYTVIVSKDGEMLSCKYELPDTRVFSTKFFNSVDYRGKEPAEKMLEQVMNDAENGYEGRPLKSHEVASQR